MRGTDAAAWFDREQQLHAESYRIWSPFLDREYQRLNDQAARLQSADDPAAWRALLGTALEVIATAEDAIGTDGASVPVPRPPDSSTPMGAQDLYAVTDTVVTALRQNRISAWMLADQRNDLVRATAVATVQVHDSRNALSVVAPADRAAQAAALAEDLDTLAGTAQKIALQPGDQIVLPTLRTTFSPSEGAPRQPGGSVPD